MNPGDIYKMDFRYQPPGQGSSYRPALILQVDRSRNLAIAVKITTSGPNPAFPHRVRIRHRTHASLHRISFAQIDWYDVVDTTRRMAYLGTLHPMDYQHIMNEFARLHTR